ncbi:MAG TPA: glycosyltransferase family 2 protein [Gaiellaceae bacterium]|nr:glycosyltransferase family 2 protein [Gaiellaceae bacterium]
MSSPTATSRSTADARLGANGVEVSVVLPCLDEESTVGAVVAEAFAGLDAAGVAGEVIVVDNGSSDRSSALAAAAGARVVVEPRRGYGSAYLAGLDAARGATIVLADADGTYPLDDLSRLLDRVRDGADVVLGSRFNDGMEQGAMPFLNRWVGNPLLTGTLNLLFGARVSDAHCGLRAVRRSALTELDLQTTGMEFASEMVFKAAKRGLRIDEVPIAYRIRGGRSKLSPFRDAWRHVRLMLVYSPTFLFVLPGGLLFLLGLATMLALAGGPAEIFGRRWEIHAVIVGAIATLVGAQIVQLGVFARTYAVLFLRERDRLWDALAGRLSLERGLLAGGAILLTGTAILAVVVGRWVANDFGELHAEHLAVVALTLIGLGTQTIFSAFFLSILALGRRSTPTR